MQVGTPAEQELFATVLDPATRTEMHRTGIEQPDSLSGVASGVFETAFIHNRRTHLLPGQCRLVSLAFPCLPLHCLRLSL